MRPHQRGAGQQFRPSVPAFPVLAVAQGTISGAWWLFFPASVLSFQGWASSAWPLLPWGAAQPSRPARPPAPRSQACCSFSPTHRSRWGRELSCSEHASCPRTSRITCAPGGSGRDRVVKRRPAQGVLTFNTRSGMVMGGKRCFRFSKCLRAAPGLGHSYSPPYQPPSPISHFRDENPSSNPLSTPSQISQHP